MLCFFSNVYTIFQNPQRLSYKEMILYNAENIFT